jgi:hypothetical protein
MTDLEKLTTDQMARAFDCLTNDEPDPPEDVQGLSRLEWGQLLGMLKIIMAERNGAGLSLYADSAHKTVDSFFIIRLSFEYNLSSLNGVKAITDS